MAVSKTDKKTLFESMPVPQAVATMAIPTIISQMISLIYNMADAFFIGRTGNAYMMAATSLSLTLTLLNVAFSNLFGVGGGSLVARLMGAQKDDRARAVSAYSVYGSIALAVTYSVLVGLFLDPILMFLGASEATIGFARQYASLVIVIGSLPAILQQTLAHLLRNTGYSSQASIGLSGGGILNIALDPLFMFVLLPPGYEVLGAAAATLLSNILACLYLLYAFRKATKTAPLSLRPSLVREVEKENRKSLFEVGIPSLLLTGLYDLAVICVNIIASSHSDLVLAAIGIVLKVERLPTAINVGLSQGMLPIVAYNYSSGNRARMKETIRFTRICGLAVAGTSILLLEVFAQPVTHAFLSTRSQDAAAALITVGYATHFLRIRATASPVQFLNFNTSFTMQAMGFGKATMLHAFVRELVFYSPLMFLLDRLFGETGLAAALPAGETLSAIFALLLLAWLINRKGGPSHAE